MLNFSFVFTDQVADLPQPGVIELFLTTSKIASEVEMQFEELINEATSIKSSHDSDPSPHEFVQPPRALLPAGSILSRTVRSINSELTCPICLGLLHDTVVVKEVRNVCSITKPFTLTLRLNILLHFDSAFI